MYLVQTSSACPPRELPIYQEHAGRNALQNVLPKPSSVIELAASFAGRKHRPVADTSSTYKREARRVGEPEATARPERGAGGADADLGGEAGYAGRWNRGCGDCSVKLAQCVAGHQYGFFTHTQTESQQRDCDGGRRHATARTGCAFTTDPCANTYTAIVAAIGATDKLRREGGWRMMSWVVAIVQLPYGGYPKAVSSTWLGLDGVTHLAFGRVSSLGALGASDVDGGAKTAACSGGRVQGQALAPL